MAASMTLGQQVTVGGGVGIGGGANAPPPPILRNGFAKGLGVGIGGGVGAALTKGRREGGAWSGGARSSMATLAIPKPNRDLLSEFEKRWQRAVDNPLEGVPFTYEDFRGALSKYDFNFEIGDTVKGTVFMTESNGALVDIGAKAPAFLPTIEASLHKVKHVLEVGISSGIVEEFQIIREDDNNGRMILSLRKAQYDMAWERCKQLMEEDVIVKGKVVAANRGGVVVNVEGIRGFVPFSQLAARVVTPEELLDKVLPLKFIEVDEEQARLVLSNRKALIDNQRTVAIGSVVEGIVQSVKPYGAFVDIGGINGLLHVSQISHERVSNVETVLSEGDKLKVMILSHDKDRGRISLSTKKLEPTPGDMLRNPALVYEKAEEMAQTFRQRVAIAEAAARAEELRLQREGAFGLRSSTAFGGEGTFKLDESPLAVQSSAKDQGLGFN